MVVVKGYIPTFDVWAAWAAPTVDHLAVYFAEARRGVQEGSLGELSISMARRIESFRSARRAVLTLVARHGTADAVPQTAEAVQYLGYLE